MGNGVETGNKVEKTNTLQPKESKTMNNVDKSPKPGTDKKVDEKQNQIKNHVMENKTTIKKNNINTSSTAVSQPNEFVTVQKTEKTGGETLDVKNENQKNGIVEFISAESINVIAQKIKENKDTNVSVNIIGRSDANNFVLGPTATNLQNTYISLRASVLNDLGSNMKESFKAPAVPKEAKNSPEMSRYLNTLLAQSRALKVLEQLKNTLGLQDFQKFVNSPSTKVSLEVEKPTMDGKDRGASVLFNKQTGEQNISTINHPKITTENKERFTNRYKAFILVKGVPNGGKNTKDTWFTLLGAYKVGFDAQPKLDYDPRTTGPSGANKRSGDEESAKNYIMSSSVNARYSTQESVSRTTTTGVDANNNIKTSIVESVETKAIPGQKVILDPINFSDLKLSKKEGESTNNITAKLSELMNDKKNPLLANVKNGVQKASETIQP